MSHNRKSKDKGLGSNSVFDLKAIVALEEQKLKATGNKNKTVEMEPKARFQYRLFWHLNSRLVKKPTKWGGQNRGVQERNARDLAQDDIDRPSLESIQAIMDRKTKQYRQLKKGKTGGLTPAQIAELPLEFFDSNSASEDDDDESDPIDPNDKPVEYTDDFGRTRTVPRSQVPRHFLEKKEEEVKEEDILRQDGLKGHFPIHEQTADKIQQIHKQYDESNNPLEKHYSHQGENRDRGAGGYNFSSDETTRQQQQQDLKDMRMGTKDNRAESGAIDLKLGESEGFDHGAGTISKGSTKRKRELEERQKAIEAKRKKLNKEEQPRADARKETLAPPTAATEIFMATAGPSTSKPGHGLKAKTTPTDLADAFLADMSEVLKRTGQ